MKDERHDLQMELNEIDHQLTLLAEQEDITLDQLEQIQHSLELLQNDWQIVADKLDAILGKVN